MNIDLSTCTQGDILISSNSGVLVYDMYIKEKNYTTPHTVRYLINNAHKDTTCNKIKFNDYNYLGSRTNEGYVYSNPFSRIPNVDHDIIHICYGNYKLDRIKVLIRKNLYKNRNEKSFEEIELRDFKGLLTNTVRTLYEAELIIFFDDDHKFKILTNRYGRGT